MRLRVSAMNISARNCRRRRNQSRDVSQVFRAGYGLAMPEGRSLMLPKRTPE
jgi:hypothetical protein